MGAHYLLRRRDKRFLGEPMKRFPHYMDPNAAPLPEIEPPPALDPYAPPFELEQPPRLDDDEDDSPERAK